MGRPIPITDYKDLTKLWTDKIQNRDPARSDLRPINTLDAETRNGNIFLIADSDGRFLDKITPLSLIQFLFCKKYECSWNFFYNLGYDAEVILKAILGDSLSVYRKSRKLSFKFGNYRLMYIPDKCLRISKGHHSVVFYDIAQFYGSSLINAYQDNIGPLEQSYIDFKNKRRAFSPRFYRRNTTAVRNYCIRDCKLTKELADRFIQLFYDTFGFYPQRWISSGYLAEKVLINNGIDFPRFDSILPEIQELAMRSYFGGRFEILKRGLIGTADLLDINSAYPSAIANLPDLTNGKWVKGNSIHPDAKIGFFKILADIPDTKYIPPFPFRANGVLVFPSGRFITYVTLDELKACENTKYYKILESWQFIPNSDHCPFKQFIEELYEKRRELKKNEDPRQLPIKLILNSIYGKTGQRVNRVIGNLFNAVVFAYITGYTRAKLYKFVIDNNLEKDIVFFATDSICTTRKLDINSSELGEFSLANSADDVFVLQNGFYRFNGKWKQRGFGRLKGKDIEHLETIEKNGKLLYKIRILRNRRLRSSIIQNKIEEIGIIKSVIREVNLNADRKRFWLGRLESIDSKLYNDSMPLSLNRFDKSEI